MLMKELPIGTKFYFLFDGSPANFSYIKTGECSCRDLSTNVEYELVIAHMSDVEILEMPEVQ